MNSLRPVLTTSVTDTRSGPNPPSSTWIEDGGIRGGIQSTGRACPCSYPTRIVVDAMLRHADATNVKDPWFFSERAGRTHVARVRADAEAISHGRIGIVEEQHVVGLSPLRCGLALLEKETRETIDMVEAQRIWEREHPEDCHG